MSSPSIIYLCISLPTAAARRQHIADQAREQGVNISFVEAESGAALPPVVKDYDAQARRRCYNSELMPNEIACALSHKKALRTFLESGADYAVIMEDDAELAPHFRERVQEVIQQLHGWEAAKLFTGEGSKLYSVGDDAEAAGSTVRAVFPRKILWVAVGWLYTRRGAQRLMDGMRTFHLAADQQIGNILLLQNIPCIGITPSLITSADPEHESSTIGSGISRSEHHNQSRSLLQYLRYRASVVRIALAKKRMIRLMRQRLQRTPAGAAASQPVLSVIVPVYNVETYLRRCLDSLIYQSLRSIEIICVNDGSTDGSADILAEYAARDARITVITQENRGLSGARNTGLRAARGELITFVDSDDCVHPQAYEKALAYMTDDVDFVAFGVQVVGDRREQRCYKKYFQYSVLGKVELSSSILLKTNVCVWNKIYRRSIIEAHGIRFPEGVIYEDNYFFHAYGAMSRCAYFVADAWYYYTRRSSSITGAASARHDEHSLDGVLLTQQLAQFMADKGVLAENRHLLGVRFFGLLPSAFSALRGVDAESRSAFLQQIFSVVDTLGFAAYPDLAYVISLLRQGRYPQQVIRYCGGLLYSKQRLNKYRLSLLGIPLWQEQYRQGYIEQKLFACLPLRRRLLRDTCCFRQPQIRLSPPCQPDDSQLLHELQALGPFAYQPNDGNMGDALIAAATMQWMDDHRLPWSRLKKGAHPACFVYGGGGIWTPDYLSSIQPVLQLMQQAERVVILPSSFRDVPQLVHMLDERFVVFCREQASYDYLCAQHTRARILLDHDMALRLRVVNRPSRWQLFKHRHALRRFMAAWAALSDEPRLFRVDAESAVARKETELDLSDALGWFRPFDSRARYELGAWLLCAALASFRHVYTDRLHVGIAALLTGGRVSFRDNSYGKISAVCHHSLPHHPLIDSEFS